MSPSLTFYSIIITAGTGIGQGPSLELYHTFYAIKAILPAYSMLTSAV